MALVEGALVAFVSMLFYGICDFLAKKAVDDVGNFSAVVYVKILAAVPVVAYVLAFTTVPVVSIDTGILILAATVFSVVAWFSFYKGLSKGLASIVVPIAGSWGMVTALLGLLVLHEHLTLIQLVSIATIFAGILLTSVEMKTLKKKVFSAGVGIALLSMIGFGVASFLSYYVIADIGALSALFWAFFLSAIFFSVIAFFKKAKLRMPRPSTWPLLASVAVAEVIGVFAFFVGIDMGMLSIVAPIVAAYTPVTVVLAYIFLHERIHLNQKIGIVLTVIGLIGVSLI
ncbi:MAG: DMT family transporter [Candidatus Diapherotrites archaeon]|nr:DMT family transporter [Candidatus Diapherotrites archaeon]